MSSGASTNQTGCEQNHSTVGRVRNKWRVNEDFGLAYKLQEEEFADHYGKNKTERRQMHVDVHKTKEEQELEDKYAAEYWEQVRRDREQEDEHLAKEIQDRIKEEEDNKIRELGEADEQLARRLQEREQRKEEEMRKQLDESDWKMAQHLQQQIENEKREKELRKRQKILEDEQLAARLNQQLQVNEIPEAPPSYEDAAHAEPLRLASGMAPQHSRAVHDAVHQEDSNVAQYMQDRELAKCLQGGRSRNDWNPRVSSGDDLISFDDPVAMQRRPPPRPPPPRRQRESFQSSRSSSDSGASSIESRLVGAVRVLPPTK